MAQFKTLIYPLVSVFGSILFGIFIEKFVLKKLRRQALKTKWETDDIIIGSFRGMIILWGIAAGVYFALDYLPLNGHIKSLADKAIFIAIVFSVSVIVARMLVGIIHSRTSAVLGTLPSTSIIANITRIVIFIIGILVILETLGISITPILTALGVGGLAVALALQETLSNLFAGIQVIASQQVRAGDYIKLQTGEEGYVSDITWRSTVIRALPNNMIIVPNAKLASTIVTNFHLPDKELAVLVEVGVSYDSELAKVEEVTIQTAQEVLNATEGSAKEFTPFIRYHTFASSSINFTVILRASEFVNQYTLKHEFVKALHKRYRENNIEIPFPIQTILLKNSASHLPVA